LLHACAGRGRFYFLHEGVGRPPFAARQMDQRAARTTTLGMAWRF
jgi:hypothetical protein